MIDLNGIRMFISVGYLTLLNLNWVIRLVLVYYYLPFLHFLGVTNKIDFFNRDIIFETLLNIKYESFLLY